MLLLAHKYDGALLCYPDWGQSSFKKGGEWGGGGGGGAGQIYLSRDQEVSD